jgi:hypothetical protein
VGWLLDWAERIAPMASFALPLDSESARRDSSWPKDLLAHDSQRRLSRERDWPGGIRGRGIWVMGREGCEAGLVLVISVGMEDVMGCMDAKLPPSLMVL